MSHSVVTRPVVKISAANVETTWHEYAPCFLHNYYVRFYVLETACDDINKKINRWYKAWPAAYSQAIYCIRFIHHRFCLLILIYCYCILRALPQRVQRWKLCCEPYDISLTPTHHPPYLYYCFGIWIGLESRTMGSSPASRILGNSTSLLRCYLHLSSDQWVTCPTPL